jgi:recombinational DNA repair protein RecT
MALKINNFPLSWYKAQYIEKNKVYEYYCLNKYVDKITGELQFGFRRSRSTIDQSFAFVRYWKKDFKKTLVVRREELYNDFIEFAVPMKLVGLIEMCLNKTYIKARIGKYWTASVV